MESSNVNDKNSSDTVTTTASMESLVTEEIEHQNFNEKECLKIDILQKNEITRITKDEVVQSGHVKLQIWVKYFTYIGGYWFIFLVFLSNILWKLCEVAGDYFLTYWTEKENLSVKKNQRYLRYYSAITLLSSFFVFARAYLTASSVIKYNKKMHDKLLGRLLKAPINLFHDTIPRGQILNRLSKFMRLIQ